MPHFTVVFKPRPHLPGLPGNHQAKSSKGYLNLDLDPPALSGLQRDESQKRLAHPIMIQDHGKNDNSPHGSLHAVGLELMERIDTFLAEEPQTPLLRSVQAQLRVSMGVVEEALGKYRSVFIPT